MNGLSHADCSRRLFLRNSGAILAAAAAAQPLALFGSARAAQPGEESTVSAAENLMRQHGVLDRMLLIFDTAIDRFATGQEIPADILIRVTALMKAYIQDFHETLEETLIFPLSQKTEKLTDLVQVLFRQHEAGRAYTERIAQFAGTRQGLDNRENKQELITSLRGFVQIYRPHMAREDTELFPALYQVVPPDSLNSLADMVEEKEWELFGEDAFAKIVEEVAAMEGRLGILEIAQFTPASDKSVSGKREP